MTYFFLRELEKQLGKNLESQLDPLGRKMTVKEQAKRCTKIKTCVKPSTLANYIFVRNLMERKEFYGWKIGTIKVSDAKLFLIKLQEAGKGSSTICVMPAVISSNLQDISVPAET